MTQKIIEALAFLTLVSNITLVSGAALYILTKYTSLKRDYWRILTDFLDKNANRLILLFSIVATFGSLFLSEVAKFVPCIFCWYQRILMYPIVPISLVALVKKTRDLPYYALSLSIPGVLLASYHYYFQVNPDMTAPCSAVGFSVSCSERFFTYYGYITIPWMALSAFLIITSIALIKLKVFKV